MQWLTLILALESGFLPKTGLAIYNGSQCLAFYSEPDRSTYIKIEGELTAWEIIFLGISADSRQTMIKFDLWNPHRIIYGIWGGLRWYGLEIGIWHVCDHNVVVDPQRESDRTMLWGCETHIYARYELNMF